MTHTQGPWKVADLELDEGRAIVTEDGVLIADLFASTWDEYEVPEDYREYGPLIAAAPDMLKALKVIRDINANGNSEPDAMARALERINAIARIAITKAEGAQ